MNDSVWQNLHMLKSLKLHEKINTGDTVFSVQPPGFIGGIYRRWVGERRNVNIGRLQDQFAIALLRSEVVSDEHERCSMTPQISDAINGLEQLRLTYAEDAQTISQVTVLITRVHARMNRATESPSSSQQRPSSPVSIPARSSPNAAEAETPELLFPCDLRESPSDAPDRG